MCALGYEYSKLIKKCIKVECGSDKIYNETENGCQCLNKTLKYLNYEGVCSFCPNGQYEANGICNTCSNDRIYNFTIKKCVCNETDNKFWDGVSNCVKCEHPNYWDYGDMKCKQCPTQQIYNIVSRQCEYCPAINPYFNGKYCTICLNS